MIQKVIVITADKFEEILDALYGRFAVLPQYDGDGLVQFEYARECIADIKDIPQDLANYFGVSKVFNIHTIPQSADEVWIPFVE